MQRTITGLILGAVACASLPAAPVRADDKTVLTESIGALSAAYLYTTHQLVGMLSDAKAKGLYDEKTSLTELGKIFGLLNAMEAQFGKLAKALTDKEEKAFLDAIAEANGLLKKQAEALKGLWEGDKTKADDFVQSRAAAWKKISAILGIKE